MGDLFSVLGAANDDRWNHMDGWGAGWMWLWGVAMMALFVVLVAWLIRAASGKQGWTTQPKSHPSDRAREILAERYARGELTTEEYSERSEQLR
jgi:putative membrane protein